MGKTLTLRFVIVGVVLLGVAILFFYNIFLVSQMNRQLIINDSLEINRVYAEKLAASTEFFFLSTEQELKVRAEEITEKYEDAKSVRSTLDYMLRSSSYYDSLFLVDKTGKIVLSAPNLGFDGRVLTSIGSKRALEQKRFHISMPYKGMMGQNVILLSQPLWDREGNYLGFLGAPILLEQDNVLQDLLGKHFYEDGSYVYVVDDQGRLIYHPDRSRIGERMTQNPAINQVIQGKEGSMQLTNSRGIEMLTGYAYVPSSKWGIISQTPLEDALEPNGTITSHMIVYSIPFLVFALVISIYLAHKIAKPLKVLADFSVRVLEDEKGLSHPTDVHPWYYEAEQLNKASMRTLEVLQNRANRYRVDSLTDTLTGLQNRRAADQMMKEWTEQGKPFALALLDIDRFKSVNDQYGHQMGDEVLIYLANLLQESVREKDWCCRYGGEEFMVLLPDTTMEEAFAIMEKIRKRLRNTNSPTGRPITTSCGISMFTSETASMDELFQLADQALYRAKDEGRNRTIIV